MQQRLMWRRIIGKIAAHIAEWIDEILYITESLDTQGGVNQVA